MLDENIDMANGTTQPKRSRRSIKTPTNKSSLNVVDNADLMIDDSEFPFLYFISKITIEHCLYLVEEHQADSSTSIVSDLADDNSEHLPSYSSPSLMNRVSDKRSSSSGRAASFDDDDENDDQFRKTFMSVVPSFKPSGDRISTPFSRRDHRSNYSNLNNDINHP